MLIRNDQVVPAQALVDAGLSRRAIRGRLRRGLWQQPERGVIVAHSGPLTQRQRWRVGLVYGGDAAVLSHRSAAVLHGLRVDERATEIVVPHGRRLHSSRSLSVHQSVRGLQPCARQGFACTDAARSVVDVAEAMDSRAQVRALVADAVQRRIVRPADLSREASHAPRRGSRHLRLALAEVSAGVRSAAEAEFRDLLAGSDLPMPEFNAPVTTAARVYTVDALWRDYGIVVEIDGRDWHLGAAQWEGDLRRQNLIHGTGLIVLRFPGSRVRRDGASVLAEIRSALRARGWRPRPKRPPPDRPPIALRWRSHA